MINFKGVFDVVVVVKVMVFGYLVIEVEMVVLVMSVGEKIMIGCMGGVLMFVVGMV